MTTNLKYEYLYFYKILLRKNIKINIISKFNSLAFIIFTYIIKWLLKIKVIVKADLVFIL